jgi:TRAP-type uncharacterized transport system substrate-binding protein
VWLDTALKSGLQLMEIEPDHFEFLNSLGWRKVTLAKGKWGSTHDHACIDYSGWPLYAREDLDEDTVYRIARAAAAREPYIVFEPEYESLSDLFEEGPSSPFDVPLHAGAQRFWDEHTAQKKG